MKIPPGVARAMDACGRGELAEAESQLRRHLARAAADASAMSLLAEVLKAAGKPEPAMYFARRVVELRPSSAGDRSNLGTLLLALKRFDEALEQYHAGQRLDPSLAANYTGEGAIRAERKEFAAAEGAFRHAIALDPRDTHAAMNLATLEVSRGRAELGVAAAREAIARGCEPGPLLKLLAQFANYATDDPRELGEVFESVGRAAMLGVPAPANFENSRDAARTLRVGVLSTDFRFHAVMHFVEHLFERLPGLGMKLYAYQLDPRTDDVTARVRPHFAAWRNCVHLNGEALARTIRDDGVDVLIDLVGWLEGGRIDTLARKAAPVQVTYCGFPNTTGLTTVDARLVDSITDPPGAATFHSEKLVRLDPCFVCYRASRFAAPPRRRPADGAIVFGSFNSIWKITRATARLWGSVLSAAPGSRMVVKCSSGDPDALAEWLPREMGVATERVTLLPFASTPGEHLAAYHEVDVALDTFPYHGTTTTCEALQMGVPVVSLQGRSHAARVGGSLLGAAGLAELVAKTPGEFATIACRLATDEPTRRRWRDQLPAMLKASALCDEAAHAGRFAGAIRQLWRDWCAGA